MTVREITRMPRRRANTASAGCIATSEGSIPMTDHSHSAALAAPRILAFVSQKGGAGKTTLALNVAAHAVQAGRRVTVLDCDPNCSAVVWADLRSGDAPEVRYCPYIRLDREIERALTKGSDLILIDTPMGADGGPVAGARHAHLVVIPCRQSLFDLTAIRASLDVAALAETPAVAVLNAVPTRAAHWEAEAKDLLSRQGVQLLPAAIRNRVAFVRSTRAGQGVVESDPRGAAASEIRAAGDALLGWPVRALRAAA